MLKVSCGTEIIILVTFQAAACHELFSSALRKFLNIYLYICMQTSKPGSCNVAKLHHRPLPAQQLAWAQLLRKRQEALGFEIKELVLIFSCDKCDWEYMYFIRRLWVRHVSHRQSHAGAAGAAGEACPNNSTACRAPIDSPRRLHECKDRTGTCLLSQQLWRGPHPEHLPQFSCFRSLPRVHLYITNPMNFGALGSQVQFSVSTERRTQLQVINNNV